MSATYAYGVGRAMDSHLLVVPGVSILAVGEIKMNQRTVGGSQAKRIYIRRCWSHPFRSSIHGPQHNHEFEEMPYSQTAYEDYKDIRKYKYLAS